MNNTDYIGDLIVYCEALFEDYCFDGSYINFFSYLKAKTDLNEDEIKRVLKALSIKSN